MTTLMLSPAEVDAISAALETYRHTLLLEIARADHREFRLHLREREALITKLLTELQVPAEAGG